MRLVLRAIALAALVAGCSKPVPPPAPPVFVPKTSGTPEELAAHLDQLQKIYEGISGVDPAAGRANLAAFADAAATTGQALLGKTQAPIALRMKGAEAFMSAKYRRVEIDPQALKAFLATVDRVETDGRGTELAPLAAFHRVWGLSQTPDGAFASSDEKMRRVTDAVVHLGEVEPRSPEAPGLLFKTAQALADRGKSARAVELLDLEVRRFPESNLASLATGLRTRLGLNGKQIGALSGPGPDGQTVDLDQLRGKWVVVHFWTNDCKGCVDDFNAIEAFRDRADAKRFEAFGVNLDASAGEAREFLKSRHALWPQLLAGRPKGPADQSHPAVRLGITELPFVLLLDQNGQLVASGRQFSEIEKEVSRHVLTD